MKRYYSIDYITLKESGLSLMEWIILENIHFKCSETGWCESSKKSLCEHHDITTQMYRRYTVDLISKGWLKTNTKGHLKTTKKWINISETKVSITPNIDRNKSFNKSETKVSILPIKKEIKRERYPSLLEIQNYISEKNLNVNAKKFFDYFEAGNWIDANGNKVKNWKQKLLTWDNHSTGKKEDDDWSRYARY